MRKSACRYSDCYRATIDLSFYFIYLFHQLLSQFYGTVIHIFAVIARVVVAKSD